MEIQVETGKHVDAIHALTKAAFANQPYSDGSEADIIRKLRADGDLALSLVAFHKTQILGHVAFSKVRFANHASGWFGLGPISVHPAHQRAGIGSNLIKYGHRALVERRAQGCILVGDPVYYARHGYVGDGRISYMGLDQKLVQWVSFTGEKPSGEVIYADAFHPAASKVTEH